MWKKSSRENTWFGNQIQLVVIKEKKVAQWKEIEDKHHAKMAKWKALALE